MTRSASHVSRALAAWREVNPQGLIGKLIKLHQRDPRLALRLAYYIERYHAGQTTLGERWDYQWLVADVARWPRIEGSTCPVCGGRGMLDDIICWRCHA